MSLIFIKMKIRISTLLTATLAAVLISCAGNANSGSAETEANAEADAAKANSEQVMDEVKIVDGVIVLLDTVNEEGIRFLSVRPQEVCSRQIDIAVKDGKIVSVRFVGGCDGNTQGISRLVEGMSIKDAISKLEGIDCGGRGTSCPDQLTKALKLIK